MRKTIIGGSSNNNKALANTYEDFLASYGNEIRQLLKQIPMLSKKIAKLDDSKRDKLEQSLKTYDKEVKSSILHWFDLHAGTSYLPTLREIASLGVTIQDRHGTEPRMVVQALDDFITAAQRMCK